MPPDSRTDVRTLAGTTVIVSVGPATSNATSAGVTSGFLGYEQVKHLLVDRPLRHQAFRPLPRDGQPTPSVCPPIDRAFGRAVNLYHGDEQSAREWFEMPIPALGGRSPRDLSRTEAGAREVETLIARIQHGIVA